jgi:glucosamine 6-phosphate synthetase-like amidotransferase/phosphosugar isomerase protein
VTDPGAGDGTGGAGGTAGAGGATGAGSAAGTASGAAGAGGADARQIDVMLHEIETIPSVMADQLAALRAPIREFVGRLGTEGDLATAAPEIVLTGCGDSHFAGIATRLAFERVAGVRCRAVEALEFVRYDLRYVPLTPRPPLLVGVSYSGEVGRTIEAVTTAGLFGWRTLALTGRRDGRLARTAGESILMDVPSLGFSPGTSTYVAMLCALYVLVAEIARAAGRATQADELDRGLALLPELAAVTLQRSREPADAVAELLSTAPVTTFLGAGPSRATAAFGAAKLFEGPQRYGVVQDLEEWAHEQYFVSGPATPTVVVAPTGAAHDRAAELLTEMAFIGSPSVLVTDATNDPMAADATHLLPVAAGAEESISPLLTCLPIALVAFFLAQRLGTRSYGFPSAEHEREHYETIHRATIGEPA